MEGNRYCESCQSLLPAEGMYCPNCGTPRRPATVSPLGPRNLGSIFKDTFRIYWAGFLGILMIVALVQIPLALLGFWFESTLDNEVVDLLENFDPEDPSVDIPMVLEALRPVLLVVVTLILATWLTSILMTGALTHAVSGQLLGNPVVVGQAYSFAFSRFGAMLGASFLAGLATILMAITIIGIPFAIFFAVRWFFVLQTASLERQGPLAALARSSELVRNNWWRTFGILLLMGILLGIANGIASAGLGLIPYLGPIVVAVIFAPVWVIIQILLYQDLRTRRDEGYGPAVLASELQGVRDHV